MYQTPEKIDRDMIKKNSKVHSSLSNLELDRLFSNSNKNLLAKIQSKTPISIEHNQANKGSFQKKDILIRNSTNTILSPENQRRNMGFSDFTNKIAENQLKLKSALNTPKNLTPRGVENGTQNFSQRPKISSLDNKKHG